jgi:hypothetical protein
MWDVTEYRFSVQKDIEYAQEFIGGSDNCLFMFHPLSSFSFVIDTEGLCIQDSTHSHAPNYSAQMSVAPFRDFKSALEFAGLYDDWVKSCISNEFFMGAEDIGRLDFGRKISCAQLTDAGHRGKDIHLFRGNRIYFFDDFFGAGFQYFFQLEESFDTAFQDFFSVLVINTDCVVSNFDNYLSGDVDFSSALCGDFFDDVCNPFFTQFSGDSCRGNKQEEFKHGFREDIIFIVQFFKDVKSNLFNFSFEFGNFLGDFFSFSGKEFNRVSSLLVFDFVGVFEEVGSDGLGVDFIGFGFSQGSRFSEVFNEQWIKQGDGVMVSHEEREDIDMVVTAGFDADSDIFWAREVLQSSEEFSETFFRLREIFSFYDLFFCVDDTEIECLKGDIYAGKIVKHGLTSFLSAKKRGGLKSGNGTLSLPSSVVIRDRCPNQLIGNGESRGHTPSRALSPGKMPSPCFHPLVPFNSLIISKLYSNST